MHPYLCGIVFLLLIKMKVELTALKQAGIATGGDCGACCIGAVANKSVAEVYNEVYGEVRNGLDYDDIIRALKHYDFEFDVALPKDLRPTAERWKQFGNPSWFNFISWCDNAYGKINAGYVGIAQVNINGKGCLEDFTDHWVIINGITYGESGAGKIVHVSCPSNRVHDMPAKDFLRFHGGYNAIWVKINNQ